MNAVISLAWILSGSVQAEPPRTYLLSIVDLPLAVDESLSSFSIDTWGVSFEAVCKIPAGWAISAGGSLTPEGMLRGRGSLGVSWFRETSPPELAEVVLVTLHGPVEEASPDGNRGGVPATFAGSAMIATRDGQRQAPLTTANIHLAPADACPPGHGV